MGTELTQPQLVALLHLLRLSLIVLPAIGCLLCVIGIHTAWKDLKWATVGNGGKQIASAMRLQVEVLLLIAFSLTLALALFFTVPIDAMIAASVLLWPVAKARAIFNAHMLILLMVKVAMYRGRRKLDLYYDAMAAGEVIRQRGLYAHSRMTDRDDS